MVNTKTIKTESEDKKDKIVKPKGKYISVSGKRKTATARVRIYKSGTGIFTINGLERDFLAADLMSIAKQSLKLTGHTKDVDVTVQVAGGGSKGQAEAIRHGISMGLLELDPDLRPVLKAKGFLTRDARKKERKKPGLKKARRAPQWSKR